jgi:hypothetical protein
LHHRPSHVVVVLSRPRPWRAATPASRSTTSRSRGADGDTLRVWADHLAEVGIEHPGVILELGKPSLQLRDPDGISIELVAPASRP